VQLQEVTTLPTEQQQRLVRSTKQLANLREEVGEQNAALQPKLAGCK
jgi:hypothetical protein